MFFKYSRFETNDGKTEFIYRPTVEIVFKYETEFILVEGLIDSGADFTILPLEIAEELRVPLNEKTRTEFYGAGGNTFSVCQSAVKIEHILRQAGFRSLKWENKVYFGASQPTILLGQNGFLNQFRVTLDGIKKQTEIRQ